MPLLGAAGAGLFSWWAVVAEAEARLERTTELLRQNALRAFGTQDAIMSAVARGIAGRDPESLRRDAGLHALLADLSASGAPVIGDVLVTDEEGRTVATSWEFPARAEPLGDRDYIRQLEEPGTLRSVGEPLIARPTGRLVIPVARRMQPGAWARIGSSFDPAALSDFYAEIAETPRAVVAMLREDGMVLARFPAISPEQARAAQPAMQAALANLLAPPAKAQWVVTPLDGEVRLFAARRVGDWPVVVAYGVDRGSLLTTWQQRMLAPGVGALTAMVLLLALTAITHRGARLQREQAESRAEAEAQLARAGRAAAIGLLAAGLAHDVKNLVQSVHSGARVMQRRADDPEEVRRVAELLSDAAERGGKLVDAMLAFARGGGDPDAPAPAFEIAGALADTSELLARTLGSGYRVRSLLPPGLPPARGDRAGFEAALVNLAANARDAMPGGGVVTIAAWVETLEDAMEEIGLRPGRHVVVAVRDTGIGMDAETLARVGEPFFTTKGPGLGTGLGLATVRGFCARAGGALRMESSPGHGTTAAMWLPVA